MNNQIFKGLRYIALWGNVLFFLWILYNGIDEGFKATPFQWISYMALFFLLLINFVLLYKK